MDKIETHPGEVAIDRRVFHLYESQIFSELAGFLDVSLVIAMSKESAYDVLVKTIKPPSPISEFLLSNFNYHWSPDDEDNSEDTIGTLVSDIWESKTMTGHRKVLIDELKLTLSICVNDTFDTDEPFYLMLGEDEEDLVTTSIAKVFGGFQVVLDETTTIESLADQLMKFAPKQPNGYLIRTSNADLGGAIVKVTFIGEYGTFDTVGQMSTDLPKEELGALVAEAVGRAWKKGEDPSSATIVITFKAADADLSSLNDQSLEEDEEDDEDESEPVLPKSEKEEFYGEDEIVKRD